MPTTSYVTPTMGASVIGARTDAAGAAVTDTTAEEARFPAVFLTEGYLSPANSFKVAAQTVPDMTVKVGSGTSKTDYYVVAGEVAGQGNYIARLDVASQNVTIDAADASQTRTDEIYLVVRDNPYDASSRALPQLGYRRGDLGGANPGPDASWKASALLARVVVGAAVSSITNANITDQRTSSGGTGIPASLVDAKGDLIVATAADIVARLAVGTNGQVLTADSAQSAGMKWAAPVAAGSAIVTALESTNSTTYTDLATVGPSVTVDVGPLGLAIVSFGFTIGGLPGSATTIGPYMHYQMSGANTSFPDDNHTTGTYTDSDNLGAGNFWFGFMSRTRVHVGLSPGATTFTAKYKKLFSGNSSASIEDRHIGVVTF